MTIIFFIIIMPRKASAKTTTTTRKQKKRDRNIPTSFSRTLPFLKILQKSKPRVNKVEILRKFPGYVINDMAELLHNILIGNVSIKPKEKKSLIKYRRAMHDFSNLPSLKRRRQFIYKQKGGFLGVILPLIVSALSQLFQKN